MNIVVLGAGAMGSLFGGYLSRENNVTLIDINKELVETINEKGIEIREPNGTSNICHPHAVTDSRGMEKQDLVIIFVKAMYTSSVLESNYNIIDPRKTFVMTLQNGAGHEAKLLKVTDKDHVIIGSTQHNSCMVSTGVISHGGKGLTSIGLLNGKINEIDEIAKNFKECGIDCITEKNVQKQIWKKLFTNVSASVLTALFQVPLGYIHSNGYANLLMRKLCEESVIVANKLDLNFNLSEVIDDVEKVCINSPNGYTSIYSDIKNGRKTEVDTISGSVVEAAKEVGVSVPYTEMVVACIHALEGRGK